MRLLLLLSAFLTALTGGAIGSAASAQPVEASASVAQVRSGAPVHLARQVVTRRQGVFATADAWQAPAPLVALATPYSFGERRRL